jgi:3,4-dihydroxy-2-butanone 4-phosphate synthase
MSWHKEQQGFLTLAINSQEVDYLKLAYLQALSIKKTQKNNKFAVLVDSNTKKEITSTHEKCIRLYN